MPYHKIDRRSFIRTSGALPLGAAAAFAGTGRLSAQPLSTEKPPRARLSCNLYSFNSPLRSGQMTLDGVIELCADLGFDAVDPTAYYFPGYPEVPDDAVVYRIKRKAYRLGLDISGTGVRNDFTLPEPEKRAAEVALVEKWIGFCVRLGAPVLRVFSGRGVPEGHTREETTGWVTDALKRCAETAARHGILIVLQNHADFIQTADQVLHILRMVNSEWLAVNLDIGSFRTGDPYAEIAAVAPYAATWQIKENLYARGKEEKTDLKKIVRIVREAQYRGYLPLETLGEGDPRVKVPRFLGEFRKALSDDA